MGNNILRLLRQRGYHKPCRGSHWVFPYDSGEHLLAVIQLRAYADESGIQGWRNLSPYGAKRCLVGGYIASPRKWKLLTADWKDVLKKYEVPGYHSREFFRRDESGSKTGVYRHLTRDQADALMAELITVISQHNLNSIGRVVNVEDFYSFSEPERRIFTGGMFLHAPLNFLTSGAHSHPYQLALLGLLVEACSAAKDGAKIHFFFDQQNLESPVAINTFNRITQHEQSDKDWRKLGSITYASRFDEIPLQVADLFVYGWNQYCTQGPDTDPRMFAALQVLSKKCPRLEVIDKRWMDAALDALLTLQERAKLQGLKTPPPDTDWRGVERHGTP